MADAVDVEAAPGGARLRLRVKPGARRDRLIGAHGGALKLEVAAAPERGRANEAVVSLLSRTFGVSRGAISVTFGATSQNKSVRIVGLDPGGVVRCLAAAEILARAVAEGDSVHRC